MPAFMRADGKTDNARHFYFGDGQLPDLICSQLVQNNSYSRHCCHGHGQLTGCEGPRQEVITLDILAVVMTRCLTLIISSWNRTTVILALSLIHI